ncbi:MAG: phosphate ABC transporter permease PstA [Planctomycetota bacterium]
MRPEDVLKAPDHLRWRHKKSSAFAVTAAASLGLGVLIVVVLVVATLRDGKALSSMHATARAGLALSQRAGAGADAGASYVVAAQVHEGTAAAALGMAQGDALLSVAGSPVRDVREVWSVIGALPGNVTTAAVAWVPNLEQLFGEIEATPVADQPNVFRATVSYVAAGTPAAAAGLRDGDVLLSANGQPLLGSQQAWQTLAVLARATPTPLELAFERTGERRTVPFAIRREGELPLERSLLSALWHFMTTLDEPRYPEHAGLASAILGSLWVVAVTMLFSFPLGIAAAVYLEEYARRSRLTTVLQVLIANLAGIPSVVYGILGLEIVARTLNLGQSIVAGGITLGLLILPVMILGCREALRTVPPWVRHAAAALGATPSQVVWHQVLPYALPGMLTAMILAISRAIGEAAPLIMLGAFLYVTYLPSGPMDTFTVVPLQIFSWATRPQAGYETIAAVAIVVLLGILLLLNGTAIVLRNRLQLRW